MTNPDEAIAAASIDEMTAAGRSFTGLFEELEDACDRLARSSFEITGDVLDAAVAALAITAHAGFASKRCNRCGEIALTDGWLRVDVTRRRVMKETDVVHRCADAARERRTGDIRRRARDAR